MGSFLIKQELEEYIQINDKIRQILLQQLDKIWNIREEKPFSGEVLYFYIEGDSVVIHTKDPEDEMDHVNVMSIEDLLNDKKIEKYKEEFEEQWAQL